MLTPLDYLVDNQGIPSQPLPHERLQTRHHVHAVQPSVDLDEDIVKIEATHVRNVLKELLCVLGQQQLLLAFS